MPESIFEVLEEYGQICSKQETANIRSIIKKQLLPQLLPMLGLQSLQQRPLSYILDQVPANGFVTTVSPIFQEQISLVENPNTRKVMKSQWKRFCQWLQNQEWYSPEAILLERCAEDTSCSFTHLPRKAIFKSNRAKRQNRFRGLREAELTPRLRQQLQCFHNFFQSISQYRQSTNRDVTQESYQYFILLFLGWMKDVMGTPVEDLDLSALADLSLLRKYEQWNEQRGLASQTIFRYLSICLPVCRFLFSQSSTREEMGERMRPYQNYVNSIPDKGDRPRVSDTACEERALSRQECEAILRYLEWRCKDLEKQQGVVAEVIDAWMDYLIIALLITTGVRQREVRELSLSRLTLNSDGTYSVKLKPTEHKNGSKTGKGRGYPLFVGPLQKQLSSDLLYYLNNVWPGQQLNHDCLFFIRRARSRGNGLTLRGDRIPSTSHLSAIVPRLIYEVTAHLFGAENARETTCHDFRRITATWVCTYGNLTHFPVYAEMLGHSEDMLRNLYAKIHPGALAAQVPIAFQEIVGNEKRVAETLGVSVLAERSVQITAPDNDQVELMRSLLKIMWMAFSKSKRDELLQALTPDQRQLLDN